MSPDWKKVVETVAPAIGAALGGPLVGTALAAVSQAVLGKPDATEEELAPAVAAASPDTLLKLKQADLDFKARMRELDLDVFKAEAADRDSARQMFHVNVWPQTIAGALFVLAFFITLMVVLAGSIKTDREWQPVLTTLLGMMGAGVTQYLAWLYGSTLGSREKTAALAASQPPDGKETTP